MLSLDQIPEEILHQILHYISPEDNLLLVHLLSRRLNQLAQEPLLWRYYCMHAFKFWHPSHNFDEKLKEPASRVAWKDLFLFRKRRDAKVASLFNEVLATKYGRAKKFGEICSLGYDAKDFILSQVQTPDAADDVLARRYFGNAILSSVRRGVAIQIWDDLRSEEAFESRRPNQVPEVVPGRLERALAAFDMFVIQDDIGDVDDVSQALDNLAAEFRDNHPHFDSLCIREQSLTLNRWLRSNNLTGMVDPETNYRNLRNCLIGHALRDEAHQSLPMVSAAIFCCIGERLGLNAHCCALPGHVLAMVFAAQDTTLDGSRVTDPLRPIERMYLDPYGGDDEFDKETLRDFIAQVGWHSLDVDTMAPAAVSTMIGRLAHNIRHTNLFLTSQDVSVERLAGLGTGTALQNLELSVYAAAWATTLLDPGAFVDITSHFALRFNSLRFDDAWLVEKIYVNRPQPHGDVFLAAPNPEYILRLIRRADELKPVLREPQTTTEFKVGNVVRHGRYGFVGVVINGEIPPQGSDLYYRLLTPPSMQGTFSLVKASSLELVQDTEEAKAAIFPDTGLFFKRFDKERCIFIPSNNELVYTPL
ncbi:F-box domain-containing protein [Colletotrichum higginsianum]|uniref:F-box domain-containing protein n=1 Tax=Colletotrichum higginsianum (strain IMI 349063) TaxID=759273 RepID=H1UZM4_COLHI|nr:F-box domain-containing protein [Colletotrichum higginsianum IMI 349063]OBR15995.1 F-box domain-containing protein [Colletotrichum higginsianum IMI 349063]GJC91748.1 F-box domain-containing protein [Colletotrichum higginsianum]CCF33425.1 F-box domain-containing protein [Colletotrichum higginsianum]